MISELFSEVAMRVSSSDSVSNYSNPSLIVEPVVTGQNAIIFLHIHPPFLSIHISGTQ
ncbi:hypothetical protein V7O67_01880 [Methanolobus sp. ZRKC4]|uniref:hypothetical protein n=1 Tax=Methanolobus sp. ZRKC4 TaxID=3125787 RepID=UPI0032438BFB